MYCEPQVVKGVFSRRLACTLLSLIVIAACQIDSSNARPHVKLTAPVTGHFFRQSRDSNKIEKANNKSTKQFHLPYLRMRNVPPNDLMLPVTSSHVLECEVGGSPVSTVYWLKNGKPIDQDGNNKKVENQIVEEGVLGLSFTRSRLYLDCLTYKDSGVYTCVGENPYNRITSESQLSVSPDLSIVEAYDKESNALCIAKESYGLAARIHMWTHNRLELIGTDAQLFCRFSGFPQPTVMWLGPDDTLITNGDRFHILENGDLTIKSLVWEDMGTYTCVVENQNGIDKTSTFLYPTLPDK